MLIKLSAVGDVIHTIPLLNKLRRRYTVARIDWLVKKPIAELLRHHPAITNVVEFARDDWSMPLRLAPFISYVRLARSLREAQYDLVIDVHGQIRTALLTRVTGAPVRIGFDKPRPEVWGASERTFPDEARKHAWQGAREGSWLAYTHHIPVPTLEIHAVDRYLSVGSMLGLGSDPADFSFPIPPSSAQAVDLLLDEYGISHDRLVLVAPSTVWETKRWPAASFADVSRRLMNRGYSLAVIGSAREQPVCDEVVRCAPGAINLSGKTHLGELAELVRRSVLCLTNDSGPMHLAIALGRPVVSIFGPTDPIWIGPYRRESAVLQAKTSCSPCYLRELSRCRYDHTCMRAVSVDEVIERIEAVLHRQVEPSTVN